MKSLAIVWAPLAIQRLEEAAEYIAEDNLAAAERWVEQVFGAVERLAEFPRSARVVPEFGEETLREVLHGQYRIIYRIAPEQIRILTVRHGRRLLEREDLDG